MSQLFASYLTEDLPVIPIAGTYDPEQELWVGSNQPQAADGSPLFQTTTTTTYNTLPPCAVDYDHVPDAS